MFWKAVSSLIMVVALHAALPVNAFAATYDFFLGNEPVAGVSDDEYEIHELVNRERSRARLRELEWDNRLANLARAYSRRMAREHFFDHYDPDGNTVIDRANNYRIRDWRKIGENLFVAEGLDQITSFAVRGWMRSRTHRQNILNRSWNAAGVGIAASRDGRIYVTQVFIQN